MKFRFCGGRDCPDWLLAEISTISRLTSIKTKLICGQVSQALMAEKKQDQVPDHDKLTKLTSDAKFSVADIQATIAALNFILTSAAKYDCDVESVISELLQLGLPKEHSTTIGKVFGERKGLLRDRLQQKSLKISGDMKIANWSVQQVAASSLSNTIPKPSAKEKIYIRLEVESRNSWSPDQKMVGNISMTPLQLKVLLADMRKAKNHMELLS